MEYSYTKTSKLLNFYLTNLALTPSTNNSKGCIDNFVFITTKYLKIINLLRELLYA